MSSLPFKKEQKRELKEKIVSSHFFEIFFRERNFSLEIHAIRPSAVFGKRRKAALRREGFTWVPDLGSFLKLLEVGVSPYLGFTLYLSVFQCFGWFEAVRGRLIGPKTWDRIVEFFFRNSWSVRGCWGLIWGVYMMIYVLNHALM